MNLCKSCGQEIIWARTHIGGLAPFDAKPVPTGKYEIKDGQAIYRVGSGYLYQSHFATCPQAAHHRNRKEGIK